MVDLEQVAQSARIVRFGIYEANVEAGELRKNGEKVTLQEQPFQVLSVLLLHPGKLITREELQKQLWPGDTFVDFDLGLNTAIRKIRTALGDSADSPKFVETLPKRGYRFIYPVEQLTAGRPNQGVSKPGRVVIEKTNAAGNGGVATQLRYRGWFALAGLLLAVGSAVLAFVFVQRSAGKMDQERVRSIDALRLEEQGTRSAPAYQSYLKGRGFLQAYDMPQKNDSAIQAFREALHADSSYGLAYAGLGEACWKKYEASKEDLWSTLAQNACIRALELAPKRAEAHICQGTIDYGAGQYQQAIADFSAAIELDPRNTDSYQGRGWAYQRTNQTAQAERDLLQVIQRASRDWHGYSSLALLYLEMGRYNEAAQTYERAIIIRPDNSELRFGLAVVYIHLGQYDRAVSVLDTAVKLRSSPEAYENAGIILLNGRRFPEAIKNFQRAIEFAPGNYRLYGNMARARFWAPGQRALAREEYERAIEVAQQQLSVNTNDPDVNLGLAIYHAMLGHKEDAIFYLDRAQQLRPDSGEIAFWAGVVHLQLGNRAKALVWLHQAQDLKYSSAEINVAPELESLRDDPEFQRLVSKNSIK